MTGTRSVKGFMGALALLSLMPETGPALGAPKRQRAPNAEAMAKAEAKRERKRQNNLKSERSKSR